MRKGQHSPKTACLVLDIHNVCHQTDVHTIQKETGMAVLHPLRHTIPYVHLTDSSLYQPIYRLLVIIFLEAPKMCKIISPSVRNNPESNATTNLLSLR